MITKRGPKEKEKRMTTSQYADLYKEVTLQHMKEHSELRDDSMLSMTKMDSGTRNSS